MESKSVEHEQLRDLLRIILLTSIPLTGFFIYIGMSSGSLSVVVILLDTIVSQLINLVSYYVLGVVIRGNAFQFPYGTGKLENFTGFFHGFCLLLISGIVLYEGVMRLTGPITEVSLGLAQLVALIDFIRIACIAYYLSKMVQRYPERSPLLHSYYISFIGVLWYAGGIFIAMLTGWLLANRWGGRIAFLVDLFIAATYVIYLIVNAVQVITANFRSLLDLPLPEEDQLKIMQSLTRHHEEYDNLINIYTRYSGAQKRIEIELSFPPGTPLIHTEELQRQMRDELKQHFEKFEFFLIARSCDHK